MNDQSINNDSNNSVIDSIWSCMYREAEREAIAEPILASHLHATILNHTHFVQALSFHLSNLLHSNTLSALALREMLDDAYTRDNYLVLAAASDIAAIKERDSACHECGTPFLYYKGFHALQAYRVAHYLWSNGRKELASYLQSISSIRFGVDIHPAAQLGKGLMLDHATGIVIGETSTVGDDVSIMQSVTLGGTGKAAGDRHPKVASGVLIGAGSKVLGNISIGEGAQICAGSVVLNPVAAHTVVAGVPATVIGQIENAIPSLTMDHSLSQCD